jgi:hypothetical protein
MLEGLRATAPEAVVPPSYWAEIENVREAVADLFPQRVGLEFRLSPGDSVVDTMFVFTRHDRSRQILAERPCRPGSAWTGIRRFFRAWADAGSGLGRRIDSVWLEFDADQYSAPEPLPGVWPADFDFPQAHQQAERFVELLEGAPPSAATVGDIRKAFRAVSPRYTTKAFGACLSRDPRELKLEAACWPDMDIEPLLDRLDPGMPRDEFRSLVRFVRRLRRELRTLVVGVQVLVAETPRIAGVALSLAPDVRDVVLDSLSDIVPCEKGKREGLRRWLGGTGAFDRSNALVKVGFKPGEGLRAKGYLALANAASVRMAIKQQDVLRRLGPRLSLGYAPRCSAAGSCTSA